jgi:hypothetical protein
MGPTYSTTGPPTSSPSSPPPLSVASRSATTEPRFDTLLTEQATGSYAWLTGDDGGTVIQQGPTRIWDRVEETLASWDDAGRPAQEQLTIETTPDAQTVVLDSAGIRRSWPLPAPATDMGNGLP